MNELLQIIGNLDMIHWLMMVFGLMIHGLMRLGSKKTKFRHEFDMAVFLNTHVREWLIALICSTACLIAIDYSGQLDQSWGAAISLFIGYANSSFFRHVMIFIEGRMKKNTTDN
jgi:hypothetical protein